MGAGACLTGDGIPGPGMDKEILLPDPAAEPVAMAPDFEPEPKPEPEPEPEPCTGPDEPLAIIIFDFFSTITTFSDLTLAFERTSPPSPIVMLMEPLPKPGVVALEASAAEPSASFLRPLTSSVTNPRLIFFLNWTFLPFLSKNEKLVLFSLSSSACFSFSSFDLASSERCAFSASLCRAATFFLASTSSVSFSLYFLRASSSASSPSALAFATLSASLLFSV
mmetsp:Transcript_4388/g.8278  ORF Transcript_4388/g.8278 Transcript_4388/m.8278 type:complete len:223 (+) Transcript_4388:2881-3549(+)